MAIVVSLSCLLSVSGAVAQTGNTIIRNVNHGNPAAGKALAESCHACHGEAGVSPIDGFPHIAGQNLNYLIKQLREMRTAARARSQPIEKKQSNNLIFRRNQRSNETMDPFVINLTDENIVDLSAYYAGLACHSGAGSAATEPPKVAIRCQVCHGKSGFTRNRNLPNIAGQDKIYMSLQLQYFRESAKDNDDPTVEHRKAAIMNTQAASLSDADIDELAAYYSGLPCKH